MDGDDLFSDKYNRENVSIGEDSVLPKVEKKNEELEEKFDEKLEVEISEATNDKEKLIFVIETRIPSPPSKPDFESSKSKLQKLNSSEGVLTKEEFEELKKSIQDEYIVIFKKTVCLHELFLKKLSKHKHLRNDYNFKVFLEYDGPLNIRLKNSFEKASSYIKNLTQSADEMLLPGELKNDSMSYLNEKNVLENYYQKIKSAASHSENVVRHRRNYCQAQLQSQVLLTMIYEAPPASQHKTSSNGSFDEDYAKTIKLFGKLGKYFDQAQKYEMKIATDDDFKLTDCLKYSVRDANAARRLFNVRNKLIIDVSTANSNLDKAQAKRRDIQSAINNLEAAKKKLEQFSQVSMEEIQKYKRERATFFKKSLIELAEFQMNNHSKYQEIAKSVLEEINDLDSSVLRAK